MFESIEIRRTENGFIVILNTDSDTKEYVFDTPRKTMKFIKDYVDTKTQSPE